MRKRIERNNTLEDLVKECVAKQNQDLQMYSLLAEDQRGFRNNSGKRSYSGKSLGKRLRKGVVQESNFTEHRERGL